MKNNRNIKKYVILGAAVIALCSACQGKRAKEDSPIVNPVVKDLQQSISRLSSVAKNIDADVESIWAYKTADSIVHTMELSSESVWRDLARSYSALSYIGYGMSYSRSARSGDVNNLFRLSTVIAKCDPDSIKPNQYLHLLELKSDSSFIFFYGVSHMERTEDMDNINKESLSLLESVYSDKSKNSNLKDQEISDSFKKFQKENKDFFSIYSLMLGDLLNVNCKSEEEFQKKRADWENLAKEIDSLPSEWDELVSKQIVLRTRLLDMIANEISNIK